MKYNRTFHFSFSPEIHSDDKVIDSVAEKNFIGREIVLSEKLDGGNACNRGHSIFARTHSEEASCRSFSLMKQMFAGLYYSIDFDFDRYMLYGENMQAIHSIVYDSLRSPFYMFHIFDKKTGLWLSYDEFLEIAEKLSIPVAPLVFRGTFNSIADLKDFFAEKLKGPSAFGPEIEGFVARYPEAFPDEDFEFKMAKYVREGHVQTDEHWSKNWKPQKIIY